ncbi:MAG: PaaI family thioesterase [Chloroflexi bacterium]|nr:PaaI family thioesterase [Chloroflexota bacterium]
MKAFQDYYPEESSYCYGCGRLNEKGLHIQSYWDGEQSLARFVPRPEHIAIPGYVYGGLLASLIDCHGTGTAAMAAARAENRAIDSEPPFRFVTGQLNVTFLRPTPLGPELELRGTVKEITPRKVIVAIDVLVDGVVCVQGEVVAVRLPDNWGQ